MLSSVSVHDTEHIWDEFSGSLRTFIRRRVKDDNVADDLLQDVFVKIHNKLHTVADADRLAPWLFRIARNSITDYYRSRSTDRFAPDNDLLDTDSVDENMNDVVGQWIIDRIDELPDAYREPIALAELQGVTQTAIAEQTGLTVSGAKSRVQRGRRMLKDMLLQCCHFEFDRRGNVIEYQRRTECSDCCDAKDDQSNQQAQ